MVFGICRVELFLYIVPHFKLHAQEKVLSYYITPTNNASLSPPLFGVSFLVVIILLLHYI